jgi:hypothetical protein
MKTYWGVKVKIHTFITSTVYGDKWCLHIAVALLPGKELHPGPTGYVPEPVRMRGEYLSLPEIETRALQPVTIYFTELYRLTGKA